jgi:hypothetical protein
MFGILLSILYELVVELNGWQGSLVLQMVDLKEFSYEVVQHSFG